MRTCVCACLLVAVGAVVPATAAEPSIDLEIVTEPNFELGGQQKWAKALNALGLGSVRIRAAREGERPSVKSVGSERAPAYQVVGYLTGRGKIVVPGGSFGIDQMAEFKVYLSKVGAKEDPEATVKRVAFGLTEEQLVYAHEQLTGKVDFATKDKPVADVVRQIIKAQPLAAGIDSDARAALDSGEKVLDELQGLSHGTALAAALRPAGLVFAPTSSGKNKDEVKLKVASVRALDQAWPIGWPMEKGLAQSLPKMTKFLNVEINDTPLADALQSIQARVEAPFLYDHNGLVRHGRDLSKIKVDHPQTKTYYKKVLDRILAPSHLLCEVRVDEAGTPLVWIAPTK